MIRNTPLYRILVAFFLLPFMVIIAMPLLSHRWLPSQFSQQLFYFPGQFLVASMLSLIGLGMLYATNVLFVRYGKGTLAPWSPPEKLVIRGPYRYMRQPMIFGVFLVLLGEAVWLASWASIGWFITFVIANLIYIPLIEEKALLMRFGESYEKYRQNVRSWFPRLAPWNDEASEDVR